MASARSQRRASGETQASEVAKDLVAEADETIETDITASLDPPRGKFRTPGFARMRTEWRGEDAKVLAAAQNTVEEMVRENFRDAFLILNDLFERVREPDADRFTGEILRDRFGWTIWRRNEFGDYIEDWSRLTRKEREEFLFRITTRLFDWEQRAADAWAQAMYAKTMWEEKFSIDYDAPVAGTIEDRTAVGRKGAIEERYFAILVTHYSRRAESLVRTMNNIALRLRDILGVQ